MTIGAFPRFQLGGNDGCNHLPLAIGPPSPKKHICKFSGLHIALELVPFWLAGSSEAMLAMLWPVPLYMIVSHSVPVRHHCRDFSLLVVFCMHLLLLDAYSWAEPKVFTLKERLSVKA